jgi:uncharacterized protein
MYYQYQYPYHSVYRSQNEGIENKKLIKVNGEGMVTVAPNQASATIGVITEGKDLTLVQKENTETISRTITILNSFNIPPKNIQTFDYQVNTEYDYVDGKQIFRGYRVTNLLKVIIDDVNQLGAIINRVIEAGANYVSNVQFSVSNPNPYYLQALKIALRNAHEKAEVIVEVLNVNWNPTPIRVEELRKVNGPIEPQTMYVKGVSTEQFQPGILQFNAEVVVKYQYS